MTHCRILVGDCIEQMRTLPAGSVHTCVTSPPYFGLRDYGTALWAGGDPNCDHQEFLGGHGAASAKQITSAGTQKYNYRDVCKKCGGRRVDKQIGLEATVDAYVTKMVAVFREVRRVLRDDGTLWLNLGDSYAGSGRGGGGESNNKGNEHSAGLHTDAVRNNAIGTNWVPPPPGYKHKELIGAPWRVAFALQADSWYLRQDIIWHKPNPMPESIRDRCTKSHEYIFLLAKSRRYYFDCDAIKEPAVNAGKKVKTDKRRDAHLGATRAGFKSDEGFHVQEMRHKRDVWTVTTKPFKGAHFATFPPDLIEPCILAGAPIGGTVLDPFGGSGTTALVATQLGRYSVLCELNPEYAAMAKQRLADVEIHPCL